MNEILALQNEFEKYPNCALNRTDVIRIKKSQLMKLVYQSDTESHKI